MTIPIRFAILTLAMFVATSPAGAASVTLPLGGIYRSGKYMPVQIATEGEHGSVVLSATGTINTSAAVQPSMRVVVPWLMMSDAIQDAVWTDPTGARHDLTAPLHPLNQNDRLVGLLGADATLAQSIFPDAHIVPVDLGAPWNPEPAPAWEALDAVIVTENNLPTLRPGIDAMLIAGTTIVVASESRPQFHHDDWTHAGALWLLHRQPLTAREPINPEAYGPTYDWIRGRTPVDRARVLILAVILSIAVVMIALWRSRWAVWLTVAVCIGGAFVVFAYDRQRPRMLELRLGMTAADQLDVWTWYSPIVASEARHPFSNLSKPVFASRGQSRELDVVLNWTENRDGRSFTVHLDLNQSLAFLDVLPTPSIERVTPEVLPDVRDFAQHLYLRPGDRIAGTAVLPQHGSLTTAVIDRPHSPGTK